MKFQRTLYRRNTNGVASKWKIWLSGYTVFRQWGHVGGKIQQVSQGFAARRGKDSLEVAMEFIQRQIKRKELEGFRDGRFEMRETHHVTKSDITFESLPRTFAPQKPIQEMPKGLAIVGDNFLIHRKRDGQRHYALWDRKGRVHLYSTRLHEMTAHMPMIVRELQDLDLPSRTLIDGEIICDRHGKDDFRATGEVLRSKPERAQFVERGLPLRYMPFDILYRDGVDVWRWPYEERWELLISNVVDGVRITWPETFNNFNKAQRYVVRHGWEGLVLWDRHATHILRMDGRHQRAGSYKWKPIKTGEFVATGWLPGKGRLATTMGRLAIAEWSNGWVPIGHVGGGFDNKTRDEAMHWKYPLVVELEYACQQEDTRALREPVFIRCRPDKTVKEMK